jgi:hypothetical protein
MSASEFLIWTALPTGVSGNTLSLSAFLSPQLKGTPKTGHSVVTLSQFPDFVNWPQTVVNSSGTVAFTVTVVGASTTVAVPATDVTAPPPGGVNAVAAWKAVFNPALTQVVPFAFKDYSKYSVYSYPVDDIVGFVSALYGNLGAQSPTDPVVVNGSLAPFDRGNNAYALTTSNPTLQQIYEELGALFPGPPSSQFTPTTLPPPKGGTVPPGLINAPAKAFAELRNYQAPPANPITTPSEVATPVLDFHQAVSSLGHYPAVLRLFRLVFDLQITLPSGFNPGPSPQIMLTPTWTPAKPGVSRTNFTPWTKATLTASSFRPTPQGPDYGNGMLNLADTKRFSVTGLDTQLAANRLDNLSLALQSGQTFHTEDVQQNYFDHDGAGNAPTVSKAVTVPALRTAGPQVIWTGYAAAGYNGFSGMLQGQKALNTDLTNWLKDPTTSNLPVLHAENVIRGHRFDVYTSSDPNPTWRSLCGRYGQYTFGAAGSAGAISLEDVDEGLIIPGASQKPPASGPQPTQLFVHESIVRWNGWGLSAQRPGTQIATDDSGVTANPGNVPQPPKATAPSPPQLSAFFTAPALAPSSLGGSAYLFPKLRFGSTYQIRGRAVDLAGNSVPVTSTDASTATPPFVHYRHEPVLPPVLAGLAPFGPGEGTYNLVLLDYSDGTAPTPNGRWLFPPRTSEIMAEQHGMFDGFNPGSSPNPADPPSGLPATYDIIANADACNLGDVTTTPYVYNNPVDGSAGAPLIGTYDANNQNVPYFTGDPLPWTPWLPDPLSAGPALSGLPGLAAGDALFPEWTGVWPQAYPILISLQGGETGTSSYTAPTAGTAGTVNVTLPPAGVSLVRISSALTTNALGQLGVWQWFTNPSLTSLAEQGQVWLLSPFQVLRMVHAVRLPVLAPTMRSPFATRSQGSLSVDIEDPEFQIDTPSTSHIDVAATWTDPVDDPTQPAPSTTTYSGPAFRLTVPDPNPTGPEARPLTLVQNDGVFQLAPSTGGGQANEANQETATHIIGDTRHHLVYYTATGTSRFAEMFATTQVIPMKNGIPYSIGVTDLGINVGSLQLSILGSPLVAGTDYTFDPTTNEVTLIGPSGPLLPPFDVTVTYQPTVTVSGAPKAVEVLSTVRPAPPVISQIVPAWQLEGPTGSVEGGGISVTRTGQFLRVYLERPWYSSGDGELLGVVTTVTSLSDTTSVFPTSTQQAWVTMMGLDPINYVEASSTPWPVVPNNFENLAVVPDVPYRPPYSNPPQVQLLEDDTQNYQVWPYEVAFDATSGRWYADVAPRPGFTEEGYYPPPPGYFIRLALCRFQPYSIPSPAGSGQAVEVSQVVLATFAQPVPDRSVSVVANTADKTGLSVLVSVTGPAYQGFRPPEFLEDQPYNEQFDANNAFAPSNPSIYGSNIDIAVGQQSTSTMVVEVQIQNEVYNKLGLEGDLAWETTSQGPVRLTPTFTGEVYVNWGAAPGNSAPGSGAVVQLPATIASGTKMRLRLSELDYYQGSEAPATVDNTYRRPFVALIPLN